jgi:UDP-4-amino-4,6-dideoxy-N-acetyl-beta-L-altrosamine transaminase
LKPIPYGRQEIVDQDIRAVVDALRAPMLTQGPLVGEFETKLAETVEARFAVAFNSGTSAIHGAYFAGGVEKGVSVLTSPITFVATANSSLYLGGGVQFADIESDVPLLDPPGVIASKAKDVGMLVPVHLCGHIARMEELSAIARERRWLLVEDAAHALGARYRVSSGEEFKVGACAHSDMCCFSFHPVKHITTGEGGAVTTNSEELYEKLKRFRSHGITRDPSLMTRNDGPWYYEQHDLGFNYRMTDFQSALGLSQLTRLSQYVERRREIARRYDEAFAGMTEIRPVLAPTGSRSSYHLYVIRVPAQRRRQIFDGLRRSGIEVNVHYIPVYQQPYYRHHGFSGYSLPNSERYYNEAISLPMFPSLTDDQVEFVIAEVSRQLTEIGATA